MSVPKRISASTTFINISIFLIKLISLYVTKFLGYTFASSATTTEPTTDSKKIANDDFKNRIMNATEITEITKLSGYIAREHVVTTKDGYLLVIHKIENPTKTYSGHKKIIYFHHGLLTSSELWVLGSTKEKTLPYLLADLGYEIWLGNNRGNKYSRKHLKLSASDPKFWDFSLDEFSYFDIPDTINYIRNFYKNNSKVTYIGFSQGCSQLFASLSLHPYLNSHIELFIGLSPAIIPQNLNHPIFKLIVNQTAADNTFLYSLFGRRAILPSVSFWSTMLGPTLYEIIVNKSLMLLFGWSGTNINQAQKEMGYPHMFSNSSVKSLVHWFQIIGARRFQMFDETCGVGLTRLASMSTLSKQKGNVVAPFPIDHHLNVPMVLFYGDNDILVDMERTKSLIIDNNLSMRDKLEIVLCSGYEHMDTLWGERVFEDVFEYVIEILERNCKKNLNSCNGNVNGKIVNGRTVLKQINI
ncbi:uncharacterized protein J8A68_005348 [[Candida] subhashii]|uniref:Partial AB-hydrolase lipase domain-containing protein n=1 Tax=[Candida] subhashii TaxID=561895 RepID=A0A8J5Q6L6_9ASCO|nr:uncharacterized protein J8A68_005348 [[Candida] subhashii]KAG7661146.1 hypothetical protein J8A68_005348 [[Candida] subhashii]